MTGKKGLIHQRQPVVFCDFDGTITERDVIIMIMEAFAPPVWKEIVDQILNQRTLSIREGVSQLFRLIPGSQKIAIEQFVKQSVQFRSGFPDFVDFCQHAQIPLLVVSGGVDFFVHPVLESFQEQLKIYCNSAIFTENGIELCFPYLPKSCDACGQCGCCKLEIMDQYPPDQFYRIAIGDSLTDLPMARRADWTFARGQLIPYCGEEKILVTPYNTFDEIRTGIIDQLEVNSHVR